jgi:hypothetical protein
MKKLTILMTALTLSFAAPAYAAEDAKPATVEQAIL